MNTEELRRVAEAATPGEWHVDRHKNVMREGAMVAFPCVSGGFDQSANAQHIAAFNPKTAIELLDRIAALEAENAALKADAERCTSECDAIAELNHAQWLALENVRTLAAKYRHEPWATHMLRFCEQAGNRAQTLRTARSKT